MERLLSGSRIASPDRADIETDAVEAETLEQAA
jgi:hypothetical protein